ncbi:hypothetical protein PM682P3_00041 [Parabacteroides phage PM682P3]|nr:hypothetical protein PM682P3_00041 [Parabacteroides phage PM682P3]
MEEKFIISEAVSAVSKTWKPKAYTWDEFVAKLSVPINTGETYKEFMSKSKADQSKIKDRGAFVGGELSGGNRNAKNLLSRSVLALDIDFGNLQFPETFAKATDFACVIHGTHKHSEATPRYRVIAPLTREVNRDEYEALARKVAEVTDIELYDKTTFQYERCMFYPTVSSDVEYFFVEYLGEPLDVDHWLDMYEDWTDVTSWARHEDEAKAVRTSVTEVEMPELKGGLIGEFCRAYTIEEGIETFLSDVYKPSEDAADRYTYLAGESSNGLQVFDHNRAFSHQQSDKISDGRAYNIYDLVRVHKFGHLDADGQTSKSSSAMANLINNDSVVLSQRSKERVEKSGIEEGFDGAVITDIDGFQKEILEKIKEREFTYDKAGNMRPDAGNLEKIFVDDPLLGMNIRTNRFTHAVEFSRLPTWRVGINDNVIIGNNDMQQIRSYIERTYGICAPKKVEDAIGNAGNNNSYHPVKQYLTGLEWDGVKRADSLFIDFMNAPDEPYVREATRIMLLGAVNRVMRPGCKFDSALILVGEQGTGKSELLRRLSKGWFFDGLNDLGSIRSMESIQGVWIIELGELSALKNSSTEDSKNFITSTFDHFRGAYQEKTEDYPRQCVFFGSTNERAFLKDKTGNRRYLPIEVAPSEDKHKIFDDGFFPAYIDQIWAEIMVGYYKGESTLLSEASEKRAEELRSGHEDQNMYAEDVMNYIEMEVPTTWYEMDTSEHAIYFNGYPASTADYTEFMQREYVTVREVDDECYKAVSGEYSNAKRKKEITDILQQTPGWTDKGTSLKPQEKTIRGRRVNLRGAFWRI